MTGKESPTVLLGTPSVAVNDIASSLAERGVYFAGEIERINRQSIATLGMHTQLVDPLPDDWNDLPLAESTTAQLRAVFRSLDSEHPQWGLNDAALNLLLPTYKEAFRAESIRPLYVICLAKPHGLVRLRHSDGDLEASELRSIGLWVHHILSALKETKGEDRRVLPYKFFLADRSAVLDRIYGSLQDDVEDSAESTDLAGLPPIVAKTYAFSLRAYHRQSALASGALDHEVDELWDEFDGLRQMIRPSLLPDAPMMFYWRDGSQTKQHEHMFTPGGAWQSLAVELATPSNTMIQVAPYHMPCRIWVRKASWSVEGSEKPAELLPGPTGRIEDIEGFKRLTVFGPAAVLIQSPSGTPATLKLEFYVQASEGVLNDVIEMLSDRLGQLLKTAANAAT